MKSIKDEDLLYLHYQIEKAEVRQKKLEDLLEEKSEELKKRKKSNRLFRLVSLVFFLVTVFLVTNAFNLKKSTSDRANEKSELSMVKEKLASTQKGLQDLQKKKVDLEKIKDLYLYRSLINKDTIYSVQLKAFSSKNVPAISEKFTNALIYSDTSLYKMSLGIFETLAEAQDFRKALIGSGFDKRIFVISYKDGKRLKIEEFY